LNSCATSIPAGSICGWNGRKTFPPLLARVTGESLKSNSGKDSGQAGVTNTGHSGVTNTSHSGVTNTGHSGVTNTGHSGLSGIEFEFEFEFSPPPYLSTITVNYIMKKTYFVYIMVNNKPTIYVGMTNNLTRRVYEHQNELTDGFTKKYHLHKLVYYELFDTPMSAIIREKQIKNMSRAEKLSLIMKNNVNLNDFSGDII
jgi:putative endonuclease